MDLKELATSMEVLRQQLKDNAEKAFSNEFTKLFNEVDGLHGIYWHQYVPGFNDGEPCEFTRGELSVLVEPKKFGIEVRSEVSKYDNKEYHKLNLGYLSEESDSLYEDEDEDEDELCKKAIAGEDVKLWVTLSTYLSDEAKQAGITIPEAYQRLYDAINDIEKADDDIFSYGFGVDQSITVIKGANGEASIFTTDYDCGY